MTSCSKFCSTAEVLAAVLNSEDEDFLQNILVLWAPSYENLNKFTYVRSKEYAYNT